MFHYGRTNEILQTSCSKLCSVQSLMNKPPPKTPTEDTTYLERMTFSENRRLANGCFACDRQVRMDFQYAKKCKTH